MNNLQRFVILNTKNNMVIGTDSGQAFTENAAKQKATLLIEEDGDHYVVVELTKFFLALR